MKQEKDYLDKILSDLRRKDPFYRLLTSGHLGHEVFTKKETDSFSDPFEAALERARRN